VGNEGFYHPINDDYNQYFSRDEDGNILALDNVATYMRRELNLHLDRHSVLWKLSQIEKLIDECEIQLKSPDLNRDVQVAIQGIHYYFLKLFHSYHKIFRNHLESN
jgi:hypothetical protein